MGRTWDALRREAGVPSESEPSRAMPAPAQDAEPMLVELEEVPFIEVGPRKSIEASPSVLACSPNVAVPSLALRAGEKAAPRSVPFRAVFLAAPESEAETPQTDSIIPR